MKTIIAPVGHNPLPVFVSLRALTRVYQNDELAIHLLYSENTKPVANRIAKLLTGVSLLDPVDPEKAAEIKEGLRPYKDQGPHLHYTGGLRFTSIAAREALGEGAEYSYLDSDTGRLWASTGEIEMRECDYPDSVKTIVGLHRFKPSKREKPWEGIVNKPEDWWPSAVEEVLKKVLAEPYPPSADAPGHRKKYLREARIGFLEGNNKWFEYYGYLALKNAFPSTTETPRQYVSDDWTTEIDCTAVAGWRLFALSATVGSDVLSKAFEVVHRSRQLGGSAARSAVLCLLPNDEVKKVAAKVRDYFAVTGDTFRVFGRDDLDKDKPLEGLTARIQEFLRAHMSHPPKPSDTSSKHVFTNGVDHIVATVGSSPIPVVASLQWLIRDSQKDYLVTLLHSLHSKPYAEAIRRHLATRGFHNDRCALVQADPYSHEVIVKAATAIREGTPNASLTFNFTGGRRTFAFHAFGALKPDSYCYLSPLNHKLLSDDRLVSDSLARTMQCRITLEEMCALHGRPVPQPNHKITSEVLSLIHWPDGTETFGPNLSFDAGFVFGYQLVGIKVLSKEDMSEGEFKKKAFRLIAWARQNGGLSARVLILTQSKNLNLGKSLADDFGAGTAPLYVRNCDYAQDAIDELFADLAKEPSRCPP